MPRLARIVFATGVITTLVAILHFVMMPKLLGMIGSRVDPASREFVVAMFYINHVGTGVFLMVLGLMLTFAVAGGIARAERWAAISCVLFGAGLLALVALLVMTLPATILGAIYFELALAGLAIAGLGLTIPILVRRGAFRHVSA